MKPIQTTKLKAAVAIAATPGISLEDAAAGIAGLAIGPWAGVLLKLGWSVVGSIVANHKADTFSEDDLAAGLAGNLSKDVYSFNAAGLFA